MPSSVLNAATIYKTSQANVLDGGLAGTINVTTRKPLDFKKPTLSFTGSMQNLDTVDGWKPRGNVFAATQLFDGRLGLMANVTYDKVNARGDYVRNSSWGRFADFDNSADNPSNPSSPPIRVTWGDGTRDEMMFCFFLLASERTEDLIHVIFDNLKHDTRQPRKSVEKSP